MLKELSSGVMFNFTVPLYVSSQAVARCWANAALFCIDNTCYIPFQYQNFMPCNELGRLALLMFFSASDELLVTDQFSIDDYCVISLVAMVVKLGI